LTTLGFVSPKIAWVPDGLSHQLIGSILLSQLLGFFLPTLLDTIDDLGGKLDNLDHRLTPSMISRAARKNLPDIPPEIERVMLYC
jgi:hypothetical protein